MANDFDGTDPEWQAREAPLRELDPELNIFALANGTDLLKNRSDAPDRTLEWYRDGMERRIRIRAEGPDRFLVTVGASRKRDGATMEALRPLRDGLSAGELEGELREILAEGIEAANALGADDLQPPG